MACKHRPDLEATSIQWEDLWIETSIGGQTLLIACIYRPPSTTDIFFEQFERSVSQAASEKKQIIITGDFNCHYKDWGGASTDNNGQMLADIVDRYGLYQAQHQSTRVTPTSNSVLDLVILSDPSRINKMYTLAPVGTSDHSVVVCQLNMYLPKSSAKRHVWQYAKADFDRFRSELGKANWSSVMTGNIDVRWNGWKDKFLKISKSTIPHKTVKLTRRQHKPWITGELLDMITQKADLYRLYKSNPTQTNWSNYTQCKNALTTELRRAEREYYGSVGDRIKNPDDSKLLWSVLNRATGKGRSGIPALSSQGRTHDKDNDKAELLNNIFVQTTKDSTHPDYMKRLPKFTQNELSTIQLSVEEVYNVLHGLRTNKAPGPDGIPNRLLKEAAPVISASLCELFNFSLATGHFPREWKQSNISPVHKKGDKTDPNNYRPIALLPTVAKVLERLVHNRLYKYLTDNNLLNHKQSGFRKGDGTVLQLLRLIDDWGKSIDDPNVACTAAVFLDVRRAFDTVWHDGLIYKLSRYGISGPLCNWFSGYLSNRQQRVVINGVASSWGSTTAGVPQGSILGPLLFLIYLNDIQELPSKSSINCFADDTSLYNSGRTAVEVANTTNADLCIVSNWFHDWGLQLHPDKCKVMCIRTLQSKVKLPPIYIAGQRVEEVTCYTHLGVTIHYTLRWKEHSEVVCRKSRQVLGLLGKLQSKLPREAMEIAYNTLVRTKLEYASVLLSNISSTAAKSLEQVQYHAGRLVSGAMARTPHGKLLEELEWDSLATRRDFNRLLIMYKLVSGSVPSHLQLLIPTTRDSRRQLNLRLRNDTHLHVPYCRTNTYGSSFVPYTTRLWNNLPKEVKEATSLLQFKQRCRAHMLSSRHHQGYRRLGDRRSNILATRLRIGWCQLNSTLAKFNLTGRGCACGATSETVTHFLLHCPLHAAARQDLATAVYRLVRRPLSTSVLLNGSPGNGITLNESLSHSFHTYITSTNHPNSPSGNNGGSKRKNFVSGSSLSFLRITVGTGGFQPIPTDARRRNDGPWRPPATRTTRIM
ncbi:hypothetical protein Bbelb_057120 [Branchiostoma belcheri]|nr:hypothetical protein Bbelb_057120 [Branchiostoma belcheri]